MTDWVREFLGDIEPYRPGKRASEVKRELGLTEIVKLSSNESFLPPVKTARLAMGKALFGLNRYPDGACYLLRNKLAKHLGVPFESIIVGNGSNELIRLLAQTTLGPGDEAIMAKPSFIVYPLVAKLAAATAVEVPLKDLTHDLEAMAARVSRRTKLIFICNPNNPTGTIVPAAAMREFMKSVPEHVLVVFDEAYHEYVADAAYATGLDLQADFRNLVILRTFSKIYGLAGARIGYGVASPAVVEAIDKVREPFNVNTVAQVGAFYSLDAKTEVRRRFAYNRRERDVVQQALDGLGLARAASQANFVYFDAGVPAAEAFERLKREGLIVRTFGDGNFVRATVGTAAQNGRLIAALSI